MLVPGHHRNLSFCEMWVYIRTYLYLSLHVRKHTCCCVTLRIIPQKGKLQPFHTGVIIPAYTGKNMEYLESTMENGLAPATNNYCDLTSRVSIITLWIYVNFVCV